MMSIFHLSCLTIPASKPASNSIKLIQKMTVKFIKLLTIRLCLSELSVGMTTEGIDVRSVGNSLTLHETALIEAFNLKAAIEYQLKNCKYSYMTCYSFA